MAAPVNAPSSGRGRGRSRSSAERVYKGGARGSGGTRKEPATIDPPRVLKEPPKDPRKERLYILIEDTSDTEKLTAIRRLADLNLGFQEVVLVIREGENKRVLKMPFKVDASPELVGKLKELIGEDRIKVC